MGRRRALLVGINTYVRREFGPLRGCVNDALRVRQLLKDYFGFENADIRVLVNERATKKAIVDRLETMVTNAREGDVLIFFYSGHGSQIRDRSGDELFDHLDEILCPHDMDWDLKTYILDDDLVELFSELPEGALLETFLDTCFWGAGSREVDAPPLPAGLYSEVRFLPPPVDVAARWGGEEDSLPVHRFATCGCFQDRNVLWAAAAEGQASAEDYFQGRVHGIFTYFGTRFIEENIERMSRGSYSRQELLDDLREFLRGRGYSQEPEMNAPLALRAAEPLQPLGERRAWKPFGAGHVRSERDAVSDAPPARPWRPLGARFLKSS